MLTITLNDNACEADHGATILAAAAAHDVYIPTLCHHPDLPAFHGLPLAARVCQGDSVYGDQPAPDGASDAAEGCGLCVVRVQGQPDPVRACQAVVADGMSIRTAGDDLTSLRQINLMRILSRHPHACLTCAQREGCSLEPCSSNVPREERCCSKFHNCELRKVAEYVGVKPETPRYRPAGLAILRDEPLFARDFNLCIDCARCVRACNNMRGVGALGIVRAAGRLVVGSVEPTLAASGCKFCGACVEVCPTGCLTDKALPAGNRAHALVPCVHTCPAGVDVPGYIRRIAAGDFRGAARLVWEKLPLANVLGHICFHLCEWECRRGQLDDPIAICALKRFALDAADGDLLAETTSAADSGKSVAVVGAGPAGLAAAFYLRFKGHAVTIFEAADAPGGMPALSIPDYRLPQDVLEKDLAVIRKLGVVIQTSQRLDLRTVATDLSGRGFDAVLVAVGLPASRRLAVSGSELDGVHWGLDFLRDVKAGSAPNLGSDVIVVGGGNVAIDVAMTALRLSRATVRLFCLESRDEMPAYAHEIEKAEAEGVEINPGWGPAAILGGQRKVTGVEFRCCTGVFDSQRNFAPTFDESRRTEVRADAVILAIGQAPDAGVPPERDAVFLAGDIAGGQASVVHAVASGRSAAERIDRYLGGGGRLALCLTDHAAPSAWIGREEHFVPRPRVPIPCAPPAERRGDFRPIEGSYTSEDAVAEARRCLQCDLRLLIGEAPTPPERWVVFDRAGVERVPPVEGVLVLADARKTPIVIKGAANVRDALCERLASPGDARYFVWEEDRMYTKRESELIQQHLKQYGDLPGGGDDELEELF